MKLFKALIFLTVLFICTMLCAEENVGEEYRMTWVLTYQEAVNSPESIAKTVDEARKAGINALLPVVHRRGRAYYKSDFLPIFNPEAYEKPLDTLAEFIKAAHDSSDGKAYVEVHPWIVCFPVWLDAEAPPAKHVVVRHPEWLTKKNPPEVPQPGKVPQKWIDPGVPGVCDYIVDVCKEIVSKYDVDGLNLDYIRYWEGGYGYNPVAVKRFQLETGRNDVPEDSDLQWKNWRRRQITNLVRRIYVETKVIKPDVKISVCGIIWGDPDLPYAQSAGYNRALQDWVAWMNEGIVDIHIPMNYRRESKPNHKEDLRKWIKFCAKNNGGRLYVNGLGNYLNSIPESIAQVEAGSENGAHGSCLFRFGVNNNEDKPYGDLLKSLRESPWKKPVKVPATPWLQKPETGMIRGVVVKGRNKSPVQDIKVILGKDDAVVHTDGSGNFYFVNLAPGEKMITVDLEGYKVSGKTKITVEKGKIADIEIALVKSKR